MIGLEVVGESAAMDTDAELDGIEGVSRVMLVAATRPGHSVVMATVAFWPARVAARKGHSFIGYFIFSLIFFPAVLIMAYVVSDESAAATAY